jgi:hypothetical protein
VPLRAHPAGTGLSALTVRPAAAAAVAEVEAEWRTHLGERDWDRMRGALDRLRQITDLPPGGEGRRGVSPG